MSILTDHLILHGPVLHGTRKGATMVEFIFLLSCLIFIATVTWVSYELGDVKRLNPKLSGCIGFVLSFLPPVALIYIAFLALRENTVSMKKSDSNC